MKTIEDSSRAQAKDNPRSSEGAEALARARQLSGLLDEAWTLPGGMRVGWDGLLGLIPGVGDVAGLAMSSYIMALARKAGAPKTTLIRMVLNVAIETIIGAVPLFGDVFDFWWKANQRNMRLLEQSIMRQNPEILAEK